MVGDSMKKIITFMLIISIVLLSFSSCLSYEFQGLENYRSENSSVGISDHLGNTEAMKNFWKDYKYTSGDYFYVYSGDRYFQESDLMYLIYNEETYSLAKKYVLDALGDTLNIRCYYNGYEFYEKDNHMLGFPYHFRMVAFNDSQKIIVFLGFYVNKKYDPNLEKSKEVDGFREFLETYYPFYSFD